MHRSPLRLALVAAGFSLLLSGCITVNVGGGGGDLVETTVHGEHGPKILLMDLDGMITAEPQAGALGLGRQESMVARVREQLDRAEEEEVRALILRIDSPGGTVTASEILHQEILRFKEKTGVPVIACFMDVAASGGYYVAMAADHVVAHPTSVTGSIGVIFFNVSLAGLMDKVGVEDQTLVTGAYKDVGSPLRRMKPEERAQLQSVIDDLYERFVAVVKEGRPGLEEARIRELADGRIYSARQAEEVGLIDGIGDLPGAIEMAEERAGLEESQVVVYHPSRDRRKTIYATTPTPEPLVVSPARFFGALPEPAFLYLWWPGSGF